MSEVRDYVAAREAVEVPWNDLREARNLKRVLEAHARERDGGEPSGPRGMPWPAAVAALVVGLGLVALALFAGLRVERSANTDRDLGQARAATDAVEADLALAPEPSVEVEARAPLAQGEPAGDPILTLPDGRAVLQPGAEVELRDEDRLVVQRVGRVHYTVAARDETLPLDIELGRVAVRVGAAVFEAAIDEHRVELFVLDGAIELHEDGRWILLERGGEAHIPREPPPRSEAQPRATPQSVGTSAAELMRRADLARAQGRLDDAIAELRTLVARHDHSPLVGAALLTIARLEGKRGRHGSAAAAFAEHVRRFPRDPLAEDAIAGAATQSALADEGARARELADSYLERFPTGIHRAAMTELLTRD